VQRLFGGRGGSCLGSHPRHRNQDSGGGGTGDRSNACGVLEPGTSTLGTAVVIATATSPIATRTSIPSSAAPSCTTDANGGRTSFAASSCCCCFAPSPFVWTPPQPSEMVLRTETGSSSLLIVLLIGETTIERRCHIYYIQRIFEFPFSGTMARTKWGALPFCVWPLFILAVILARVLKHHYCG